MSPTSAGLGGAVKGDSPRVSPCGAALGGTLVLAWAAALLSAQEGEVTFGAFVGVVTLLTALDTTGTGRKRTGVSGPLVPSRS